MTRPERVRCENCCFWDGEPANVSSGDCLKLPYVDSGRVRFALTYPENGCGEFSSEWPGADRVHEAVEIYARNCAAMSYIMDRLRIPHAEGAPEYVIIEAIEAEREERKSTGGEASTS